MPNTPLPRGIEAVLDVSGDTPVRIVTPEVGMRILINNAGGFDQHPGPYGYTETVVLDIETEQCPTYSATRVKTDAYGWGCWEVRGARAKVRA